MKTIKNTLEQFYMEHYALSENELSVAAIVVSLLLWIYEDHLHTIKC